MTNDSAVSASGRESNHSRSALATSGHHSFGLFGPLPCLWFLKRFSGLQRCRRTGALPQRRTAGTRRCACGRVRGAGPRSPQGAARTRLWPNAGAMVDQARVRRRPGPHPRRGGDLRGVPWESWSDRAFGAASAGTRPRRKPPKAVVASCDQRGTASRPPDQNRPSTVFEPGEPTQVLRSAPVRPPLRRGPARRDETAGALNATRVSLTDTGPAGYGFSGVFHLDQLRLVRPHGVPAISRRRRAARSCPPTRANVSPNASASGLTSFRVLQFGLPLPRSNVDWLPLRPEGAEPDPLRSPPPCARVPCMAVSEKTRKIVWAEAGGRCAICRCEGHPRDSR